MKRSEHYTTCCSPKPRQPTVIVNVSTLVDDDYYDQAMTLALCPSCFEHLRCALRFIPIQLSDSYSLHDYIKDYPELAMTQIVCGDLIVTGK